MTIGSPYPIRYDVSLTGRTSAARSVNGLAFALLWLFVFTVPWGDGMRESAGLAFSHWVGLIAFCAGAFSVLTGLGFRKPTAVHYLLFAFVAWSALSYFWSVERDATATRILTYVQLLAMVWLIWELAFDARRQIALLSAYVLGTFVSCFETIHNFLSGRTIAEMTAPGVADNAAEQRFVADGFNANEFALVLAISIPITFFLLSRKNRSLVQLLYWMQFLAALMAILLTGSRSALFATAVGALMYFSALRKMRGWQKSVAIISVPLALTVALIFVPDAVLQRFSTIGTEVTSGTLTKRTIIWSAGFETFRDHAVLGVGSGAFGSSVMNRLDVSYAAHNTFLSVLVELGAIGALIFIALLATLFSSANNFSGLSRSFWLILLATWCVGVFTTTWEQRKPTWFLFGMLPAQASTAVSNRRRLGPSAYRLTIGSR